MYARIIALLGTLMVASLLAVLPTTPAQADTCLPGTSLCQGGRVDHVSDDGYDPAIIVFCNYNQAFPTPDWSKEKYVAEGTSSHADCGDDTDVVWIRPGEELWCQMPYDLYWKKIHDATGAHKIGDLFDGDCVLQKD